MQKRTYCNKICDKTEILLKVALNTRAPLFMTPRGHFRM